MASSAFLLLNYAESLENYKNYFLVSFILFAYGIYELNKKFFEFDRNEKKLLADIGLAQKGKDAILNKGKEGEDKVSAVIDSLRDKMDFIRRDKSWMPIDSSINEIVIKNGEKSLSQEIDGLIVTGNIVFLIEIKNWWGNIYINNGNMYRNGEIQKSPEEQTKLKSEKLYQLINHVESKDNDYEDIGVANIVPVYIFPNYGANLDPNLPHNYIKLDALSSFISYYRDQYSDVLTNNLEYIKNCILDVLDKEPNQKQNHLLRIAKISKYPSKELVNFRNLHDEIIIKQGELNVNAIKNTFKTKLQNSRYGLYLISQFVICVGIFELLK